MTDKLSEPLFPSWPVFTDEMVEAAAAVLRSGRVNYWTGSEGKNFEKEFANWVGARYGVALANGTVAIEAALHAIDIQPGDEVVVTPRTFVASASAIFRMGGVPVFADVDRDSGNLTAATVEAVLSKRTRAVVAVHLAGWPVEMGPLMDLAAEHKLFVIEDAAQAHGAMLDGKMAGSLGHLCAFSFCQDKIITTAGEGGMVTCDDEDFFKRVWAFKDHGKDYDRVFHEEHPPGFRWLVEDFGTNLRMTEVQAAVGRLALSEIASWLASRRRQAGLLIAHLEDCEAVRVPIPRAGIVHSYYRFYCYLRPERLAPGWDRDRVVVALNELGIPVQQGGCSEIYRERAFERHGLVPAAPLPVARELGECSMVIPVHQALSDEDTRRECAALTEVLSAATGSSTA